MWRKECTLLAVFEIKGAPCVHDFNESVVSLVARRYTRAGIGNELGLFVRISTLTYCIAYILHVHDRIVVSFSNISAYFARNAEYL